MNEFLLLLCLVSLGYSEEINIKLVDNWPSGFKMKISHIMSQSVTGGWKMSLKFSKPIGQLQAPNARRLSSAQGNSVFCLRNQQYNGNLKAGSKLEMEFIGEKAKNNEAAPSATLEFHPGRNAKCDMSPFPTVIPPGATPPVQEKSIARLIEEWPNGFKMKISILMQQKVEGGWEMTLTFPIAVRALQTPKAFKKWRSSDRKVYILENRPYNANLDKCSRLEMIIIGRKQMNSDPPSEATIEFRRKESWIGGGEGGCTFSTTQPPTTTEEPGTSMPPVTAEPPTGTEPPTSTKPTTKEPVTATEPPTTIEPTTTNGPTTVTEPPTTKEPDTTEQPATNGPTTITEPPATTEPPTTNLPTTVTEPPTATELPTTKEVTTERPLATTESPSTKVPSTTTEQPTELPTTNKPSSAPPPFDYDAVLHDSILFYEAQRSGKLPSSNRVPWRKDSALGDRGDNGEDLTGGWYDAGDHVKFGFPMAFSVTMLSWGLVEYRDAYEDAGELSYMLDSIKWPLDYFMKAHTKQDEFYGQVGDGNADHGYWGRPEDMTMRRPAWKITPQKPGSDLAAETAAALAAASIAFRSTDISYSMRLLQHAAELYDFADKNRGLYSDSIPNAASFYRSHSGYKDELVWGAAWLYKATQDQKYLSKAEQYYNDFAMNGKPWAFSWDDKKGGVQVLLAAITNKASYKQAVDTFITSWLPGHEVHYTPKGLAWRDQWGPNRYSANTAFLALVAADHGIRPTAFRNFAKQQIHYMLGDSDRSFVVGFGTNPPERPHHRSSSCPLSPVPCSWNDFNKPDPNPQILYGALVGGPGKNDEYKDDRTDFIKNEVATDYNAGFQSAVAGLKHLSLTGKL